MKWMHHSSCMKIGTFTLSVKKHITFEFVDMVNATPPCFNGDLRLAGGSVVNGGRVEICYQNQWGTICDDNWDIFEAKIVCSQLGYPSLGTIVCLHCNYIRNNFITSYRCNCVV